MHSLSCALLGISLYIRRLVHDSARGSFQNQPGLAIKASGFGDTCKVEYLVANPIETSCSLQLPVGEYFHTLVKHFTALGYKRGQTIRSAPYDWRLSPGMYPITHPGRFAPIISASNSMYGKIIGRIERH